jgi:hypothetical protein
MAAYALLLLSALLGVVIIVRRDADQGAAASAAAADSRLVYCLQNSRRADLVSAAAALRLARPGATAGDVLVGGRQLTLPAWRQADSGAFDRACNALAAIAVPPPSGSDNGTTSTLEVLLPVVAGAVLTLAADDIGKASDRRWAQADALRAAGRAFAAPVLAYAKLREEARTPGLPSRQPVDDSRRDLTTALRNIHSQHRRSPTIKQLQITLAGDCLGPPIADNWAIGADQQSRDQRKTRTEQIKRDLEKADSSLEKVAHALERRIWLSWRL